MGTFSIMYNGKANWQGIVNWTLLIGLGATMYHVFKK